MAISFESHTSVRVRVRLRLRVRVRARARARACAYADVCMCVCLCARVRACLRAPCIVRTAACGRARDGTGLHPRYISDPGIIIV